MYQGMNNHHGGGMGPITNYFSSLTIHNEEHSTVDEATRKKELALVQEVQNLEKKGNVIFGQCHTAVVTGYTQEGFVTKLIIRNRNEKEITGNEPTLDSVVVKWSTQVQRKWKTSSKRLEVAAERVPIGSSFKVYIGGICDYEGTLRIKHAQNPDPVLAYVKSTVDKPLSPPVGSSSIYRYLVIIDFEATCDYNPSPVVYPGINSEIIEFPWVVLDTTTLQVVHEERYYIRPDFIKGLTHYCSALTGIDHDTLQDSITLKEAVVKFNEFIQQRFENYQKRDTCKSFRILTDGMWDLQVQLLLEAKRKHIKLDWWFLEYFDIKQEFQKFLPFFNYEHRNKPSLSVMLKAFHLDFVGKHHSGLDDCKTITQLLIHLIKHGHLMTSPQMIPEHYDPLLDQDEWNTFPSRTPPGAWSCSKCELWNRPYSATCYSCKAAKDGLS